MSSTYYLEKLNILNCILLFGITYTSWEAFKACKRKDWFRELGEIEQRGRTRTQQVYAINYLF